MTTVTEVNFVRLLTSTEDLVYSDSIDSIKLTNYVNRLNDFYEELSESRRKPTSSYLSHYNSRIKQLQCVQQVGNEKQLEDKFSLLINCPSILPCPESFQKEKSEKVNSKLDQCCKSIHYFTDIPDVIQYQKDRLQNLSRRKLLGDKKEKSTTPNKTMQSTLSREAASREAIAAQMVGMTTDLRESSMAIVNRLRGDIEVVEKTSLLVDQNAASLRNVSDQLNTELGKGWGRLVWLLFILCLFSFPNMVLFMRLNRK